MQTPAGPTASPDPDLADRWDQLLFGVKRSVRYHTCRRNFFERCGVFTNFLVVFVGSGTGISAFIGNHSTVTASLAFIVAGLSAFDLILGYSSKARLYHDLAREFIKLERDMVTVGSRPAESDLIVCSNKRLEIEATEPPKLNLLDVLCHNEVARALGRDGADFTIPAWKRSLCHLVAFDIDTCARSSRG